MLLQGLLLLGLSVGLSFQQGNGTTTNTTSPATPTIPPSVLSNILSAAAKATDCVGCFRLVETLKQVAEIGPEAVASVGTTLCIATGAGTELECTGLQRLEAPSVTYALLSIRNGSRSAQVFCESLLGLCPQPAILPYSVPIKKPKPTDSVRPTSSGKEPIKVVHLSDLHVDSKYTVGLSRNCSDAVCCRSPQTTTDSNFTYPARPFGEYTCDSPVTLEDAQYAAIRRLVPDRAFTIVTGDVVEGASWQTTNQIVVDDVTDIYTRQAAGLGLVFPAMGNHDANPVNSFPPTGVRTVYNNTYIYDLHSRLWSRWIGPRAARQVVRNKGSYTTKYGDTKLRIISVNTMFWEGVNWWIYNTTMARDPSGVFAFMASALQEAEDCGERAWIIGHIPPGRSDALYDYSSYFDQLVQRYSDTIAALFWGHTHRDQFEVSYADYSQRTAEGARAIGYIAPGLTPTSGNPNFRVYTVDPETFAVLDITVYSANLSDAAYQTSGPDFQPYYSAKAAYGSLLEPPVTDPAAELTPAFWHNVTELFERDDNVFQQYIARKSRGYNVENCNGMCKSNELCQLRSSQSQFACLSSNPVLQPPTRRRDVTAQDTGGEEHECSRSINREVFRKLAGQGAKDLLYRRWNGGEE